ncbi:hypothetical protein [Marivirga arenosa]|uniref:Lipoprotein n=1 Tax=Marivirga arenosa TaxID=3059076 RepID=A0AA49JHM2_9BACT|nr:hypothetical protein [Marivirga sp. BKB1-2]WKK81386.2 hypothetical protein QYS47_03385 [Marivirga sp. BKB1-2]
MKSIKLLLCIGIMSFLFACGSSESNSKEDEKAVMQQEEKIATEVEESSEEVKKEAEETEKEVDKLLEDI